MNNCIKCGCEDAYPSLPPCPSPEACPNPQPCAEVFDAQCVKFTLPNIICNETIVVAQDDSISDALIGIVSYFCNHGSDGIQSVTGLNTNNADPQNPVVRISVDGTTITGLGTPASPLIASGGIAGSGIQDYVARWTPDGTTLGTGLIQDNNSSVSIGVTPDAGAKLAIQSDKGNGLYILQTVNGCGLKARSIASGANTNTGGELWAGNSTTQNVGAEIIATGGGTSINIGITTQVYGGATNYAAKLSDGTEGIGKVLTCVGTAGLANWVTPATGIAGSGIQDYVARWTPDGNTLGYGTIQDNGLTAGVNGLVSNIDFVVGGTTGSSYAFLAEVSAGSIAAIKGQAVDPSATINTAIAAVATNTSTGGAIGGNFNANGLTTGTGDNIGVKVLSAGTLATKYAVQLQDGTEGIGKVLTSVTADGKANWADANPQKFITYPADFPSSNYTLTSADNGYSIVVINGSTAVTITVPTGLVAKMQVGFIQDGTGNVTFTPSSTLLKNAISGYKIKGQYDQAYLEQGSATNIYYLLGNTKV